MKSTNIKVSIIVPIYNAGIHLRKCLDTLVNQSLREIELIFILDCPTDGSDLIAEEYATRDDRIILIRNETNLHIGMSRNKGLEIAKGEYIGFSDHDDIHILTMYEELYSQGKLENSDLIISAYGIIEKENFHTILYPEFGQESIKDTLLELSIGPIIERKEWRFFVRNGAIWNKIFKREIFDKYKVCFVDTKCNTYEDLFFLINFTYHCKSVSVLNKAFYIHNEGINNTSSEYAFNSYPLVCGFLMQLDDFLQENKLYEKYEVNFYNAIVNCVICSLINEVHAPFYPLRIIKALFHFRKFKFVQTAFRLQKVSNVTYPARNYFTLILRSLVFIFYRF